jgi:ABC-type amino acid transport substrate-binding protein
VLAAFSYIKDICRNMARCTIGVVANTTDEEYLKRFHTNTLYRHIQYIPSYGQGIDLLREHSITYLLMDRSMARYYLTRDVAKLIRISGDNFGEFGLSLGFSKFDTDLKNDLTNILLSYVDKGRGT